jgi:hypothetical protein
LSAIGWLPRCGLRALVMKKDRESEFPDPFYFWSTLSY